MNDLNEVLGELKGLGDEPGAVKDDVVASVKEAGADMLNLTETTGDVAEEENGVVRAFDSDNSNA